jgi:hypothetical protein
VTYWGIAILSSLFLAILLPKYLSLTTWVSAALAVIFLAILGGGFGIWVGLKDQCTVSAFNIVWYISLYQKTHTHTLSLSLSSTYSPGLALQWHW